MRDNIAKTATFGSAIGMVLATAGSAVGLGNVWRFPTMTGENGGAAFIFIYMICNVIIGLVGMLAEFVVGRNGGSNPFDSFAKAGMEREEGKTVAKGQWWASMGVVGSVATALILSFYSVVAGWCIYYLNKALSNEVLGTSEEIVSTFTQLTSTDGVVMCVTISLIFILITFLIVARGVEKGIEKASKLMMPLLFLLLIVLCIVSCLLPGAVEGLKYLFLPDISKITWKTVYEAMSHSFFSLSLGIACLATYASYMKKEVNLMKATIQIACIDIGVALLAGVMIFPAAFSVGINPDSGPSLIFLTLPNVFTQAFSPTVGYVISILFYFLLTLAALTSTISMLEVGTIVIEQKLKVSRFWAATTLGVFCMVMGSICAISIAHPEVGLAGSSFFDNCDYITAKFMMPLGGLATCILVGWVMPKTTVIKELTSNNRYHWSSASIATFLFLVRFVCPICIGVIFIGQLI